jgi:hypothetical protein
VFNVAGRQSTFVGSGTFVIANGEHHVLTAAHVWQQLSSTERLAFKLEEGPKFLVLPRNSVRVQTLPEGSGRTSRAPGVPRAALSRLRPLARLRLWGRDVAAFGQLSQHQVSNRL